jgi:hypothetical protein
MIGSLRVGRRGASSKIGFDHVGEDGARLDEVESCDGRIHLIEILAATQKFGIDRADFVEHLLQLAEVGQELRDLGIRCIRNVAKPRALAGSSNCGQISLGAVAGSVDAVASGSAAAFVGLDQRTTHDLLDWWQATHQMVATFAQCRGRSILHIARTESV